MSAFEQKRQEALAAWRSYCEVLERTGVSALESVVCESEQSLAEGLRHLTRLIGLTNDSEIENRDTAHPYLSRNLGPTRKMGGDNPTGVYLGAPLNGTDVFCIEGSLGNAGWISFQIHRSGEGLAQGLPMFGDSLLSPDIACDDNGDFKLWISPAKMEGNWIGSDPYTDRIVIRQFFESYEEIRPMSAEIENVSSSKCRKAPLTLNEMSARMKASSGMFAFMPLLFAGMVGRYKQDSINCFASAEGGNDVGGVPGGEPRCGYFSLAEDEALVVTIGPRDCYYWDVQISTPWFESFDYRHVFSGLSGKQVHCNRDGSATLVISPKDPGTVNWLETLGHLEGAMSIRFQRNNGAPPDLRCDVVKLAELAQRIRNLPKVSEVERREKRRQMCASVQARYPL